MPRRKNDVLRRGRVTVERGDKVYTAGMSPYRPENDPVTEGPRRA